MSKKLKITVPAVIGIVLILLIIPRIRTADNHNRVSSRTESRSRGGAVNVNAVIVQPEKLANTIVSTGTVLANEEVELRSEISGKIVKIYFKEGSHVRKGDLLLKINDADLQAQLSKANFLRERAEQREYRQRMILKKEGTSQETYETALSDLNTQKAEIDLIKAQIAKTEIRAPFDGTIGLKSVSEGSYISPSTKIASLQNTTSVKIDFSIPERYSNLVKTGNTITFTIQGNNDKYSAKIFAIEPKIDPVTRTLQIRAISNNKSGSVHPGSFAKVELFLNEIPDAIMVPTESLVQDIKGTKVFVSRNGKASAKVIELGIRKESKIQVVNGLNAGDTVLTTGLMQIKPGSPVKIVSTVNE
ncbi:MAG: efflux RND transporter periplasmic adaptor subunit [Bacillota bacterium]